MTIEAHNYKDMTGKKIGRWMVLEEAGKNSNKTFNWLCRCDCGTERIVRGEKLRQGKSNSCGCSSAEDISGTRYGDWVASELKRKFLEKTELPDVWAVVRPITMYPASDKVVVAWFYLLIDALEAVESINIPKTEVVQTTVYLVTNKNDELDAEAFLNKEAADKYIFRNEGKLEWRCICSHCGAQKYFTRCQLKCNIHPKCECDPGFDSRYQTTVSSEKPKGSS